jgi:hypothetical protein
LLYRGVERIHVQMQNHPVQFHVGSQSSMNPETRKAKPLFNSVTIW